jgi:hypothetical protein
MERLKATKWMISFKKGNHKIIPMIKTFIDRKHIFKTKILVNCFKIKIMKATEILSEMVKTTTIYGKVAALYVDDEIKANEFILECYEQLKRHPKCFIECFGPKIYYDIQSYLTESVWLI